MPTTTAQPVRRYFRNIARGVATTASAFAAATRHLFTPTFTIQYPRQKVELPDRTRHRLHVIIEDCIGCLQCERACPVECIRIDALKAPKEVDLGKASSGNPINFWLPSFTIDMAKCCYCGLCTDPCPTECITMTPNYEYSSYEVTDQVYQFARMSPAEIAEARRLVEEDKKRQAEEKARKLAEKAAKAPSPPAEKPKADTGSGSSEPGKEA
jgi:formate hydrogenlyase subunit 6/NADH:ubiquinone oxidoreductase subunit I